MHQAQSRPYRLVSLVLGTLLLAAGSLKAAELGTGETFGGNPTTPLWQSIGVVEFEWLFGMWLVLGLHPTTSRRLAIVTFAVFALVALGKALTGEDSCGCFGKVAVNPWITSCLDLLASALLLIFKPQAPRGAVMRANPVAVASLLTLAVWVGGGWAFLVLTYSRDSDVVILKTDEWVGRKLPILDQIAIEDNLTRGNWLIVLYHHDCRECRVALPEYERLAHKQKSKNESFRIALIELPPYSGPGEAITSAESICAKGRLPASKSWVVRTPAEIAIRDGIVVPGGISPSPSAVSVRKGNG